MMKCYLNLLVFIVCPSWALANIIINSETSDDGISTSSEDTKHTIYNATAITIEDIKDYLIDGNPTVGSSDDENLEDMIFRNKRLAPEFSPPPTVEFSESNDTTFAEMEDSWLMTKVLLDTKFAVGNNPLVRPVLQQDNAVRVNITFYLHTVAEFDTADQKMDLVGHFMVEWEDEILRWEADEFGHISNVNYPLNGLWYPKLIIDKTYGGNGVIGDIKNDIVKVKSDGTVHWRPSGVYSVLCNVDALYYPFDTQTCDIEIYVTDHTKSKVALSPSSTTGGIVLLDYVDNPDWELLSASSVQVVKYDTNFVTIRIHVERMASFTIYTMVIPLLTLSVLSVLSYLVSFESGEKIDLSMTVFMAYGFFAIITQDSIPSDSIKVPHIVKYITTMLILSLISVLYIMFESKIYFAAGEKPCQLGVSLKSFVSRLVIRSSAKRKTEPMQTVELKNEKSHSKDGKTPGNKSENVASTAKVNNCKTEEKHTVHCTWSEFLGYIDWFMLVLNSVILFIINLLTWIKIINRI